MKVVEPDLTNKINHEELLRVSWYYYKMGLTQTQIAKKLKTNRARIMKLLEMALDEGIVEIRIKDPRANLLAIEQDLINKYDLLDAVVVPTDNGSIPEINNQLGMAAAQYINSKFTDEEILAIGWGDSVSKTVKYLSLDEYKNFYLVSLSGGMLPMLSEWKFFAKYLNHVKILPSPFLLLNEATADSIYMEPEVQKIFKLWDIASMALIGIGSLDKNATIIEKGYISEVDTAYLKKAGVVGDILGQFFDKEGNIVPYETDRRLIAQNVKKVKKIPNVIAVAGGMHKLEAIQAALNGKYIKTLIVDEQVTLELLK
jgi:Transcriptional regulator, contains sigma factor-related N-terminal domain